MRTLLFWTLSTWLEVLLLWTLLSCLLIALVVLACDFITGLRQLRRLATFLRRVMR